MEIDKADYLQSAVQLKDLPPETKPEYAFTGRSNVGKSSLINMLCNRNKLAITSSKPGKTRTINHFIIDQTWYLVDLPGYGFARVSKKEREKWAVMVRKYVTGRKNLVAVFLLIDLRVEPLQNDLDFIELLGKNNMPFVMTFTKSDKLKQSEIASKVNKYREILKATWDEMPPMIVTSSKKGLGKKEILAYIENGNAVFRQSLTQQG